MSSIAGCGSATEIGPVHAGAERLRRPGLLATNSALRGKSTRSAKW